MTAGEIVALIAVLTGATLLATGFALAYRRAVHAEKRLAVAEAMQQAAQKSPGRLYDSLETLWALPSYRSDQGENR